MAPTLLRFSLGPVQEFIAAARTVRDLWTGSYLLSWLTAHAISVAREQLDATIIFPAVENPLLEAVHSGRPLSEELLRPCLPNTFLASVSSDAGGRAKEVCTGAVKSEWRKIANRVRELLETSPPWNRDLEYFRRWNEQCDDYWDVRVTLLSGNIDLARCRDLVRSAVASDFQLQREVLDSLAAADKSIRRYPQHEPEAGGERETRAKCSLLGSFAQMGPVKGSSADFWREAARVDINGTRIGRRDRFCAISLVKRFAWAAYFGPRAPGVEMPYPDIDTVCAEAWLRNAGIDRTKTHAEGRDKHYWSGHWLRWADQHDGEREASVLDDPEPCPVDDTWKQILRAKREQVAPPSYYAALMLDGDGIGEFVRRTTESEGLKQFSSMLASFALQSVPAAIQSHLGTLVYAGGDDVLALLPASKALSCAHALAEAFQSLSHAGRQLSCSGSVVVAHYKANLRDVLNQARRSEKQAKEMRREANDDCGRLAITVLRRSGEHSTAVCPWDEVRLLSEIVNDYRSEPAKDRPGSAAASDRWAYQFRRELEGLPERADIHQAEFTRYLNRLESPQLTAHCQRLRQLWEAGANRADATKSFLHLVQSASFLARAGKE